MIWWRCRFGGFGMPSSVESRADLDESHEVPQRLGGQYFRFAATSSAAASRYSGRMTLPRRSMAAVRWHGDKTCISKPRVRHRLIKEFELKPCGGTSRQESPPLVRFAPD